MRGSMARRRLPRSSSLSALRSASLEQHRSGCALGGCRSARRRLPLVWLVLRKRKRAPVSRGPYVRRLGSSSRRFGRGFASASAMPLRPRRRGADRDSRPLRLWGSLRVASIGWPVLPLRASRSARMGGRRSGVRRRAAGRARVLTNGATSPDLGRRRAPSGTKALCGGRCGGGGRGLLLGRLAPRLAWA